MPNGNIKMGTDCKRCIDCEPMTDGINNSYIVVTVSVMAHRLKKISPMRKSPRINVRQCGVRIE
jgi:hypothetical protein